MFYVFQMHRPSANLPLQDAVEKFHAALEEGDEAEVWSEAGQCVRFFVLEILVFDTKVIQP